jgi:DNA-binding transcriptional ArsR family regulator
VRDRITAQYNISPPWLTQPNVSNHLACLRGCGLVVANQMGRYVRYQLSDKRVALLLRTADELLVDVARGVSECTRYEDSAAT